MVKTTVFFGQTPGNFLSMYVCIYIYIYILGLRCSVEDAQSTVLGRSCTVAVVGVVDDSQVSRSCRTMLRCIGTKSTQNRTTIGPKSVQNRSKVGLKAIQNRSRGRLRLPERSRALSGSVPEPLGTLPGAPRGRSRAVLGPPGGRLGSPEADRDRPKGDFGASEAVSEALLSEHRSTMQLGCPNRSIFDRFLVDFRAPNRANFRSNANLERRPVSSIFRAPFLAFSTTFLRC